MVPGIKAAQDKQFKHHANQRGAQHCAKDTDHKRPTGLRHCRRQIGTDHIERSVRQIDHVHDAEHQRQARSQQKQHEAELKAVKSLFKDKLGHLKKRRRTTAG